jgi:hypothetical protein
MPSPSSSSQNTVVSDSAGDQASLALSPTGLSALSVTAAGGGPTAAATVSAAGAAEIGASASSNLATVVADASTATCTVDAINSLNVESKLTVRPGFLAAITNGGGASETPVQNQIGVVNTVNLNSSPNASFTNRSNNRVSVFSGIGQFVDNSGPEAQGTVNCDVPFPLPPGATVAVVRLEITLLVKCVVTGAPGVVYRPFVGDYFLQKLYTTWVNNNGTLGVANANVSGSSPINNFTGVATLDTSGTTFTGATPSPFYKLDTTLVVTPGGGGLLVQATPGVYNFVGNINVNVGTALVEIYVTAYYN